MRRRRALALGASAAAGFAGCLGIDTEGALAPPTAESEATRGSPGETTGASTSTPTETPAEPMPRLGGSLHGRPHRILDDLGLVEESGTSWIHAFFDVRRKFDGDVQPAEDRDVIALRRASREAGANLFVTLQWNFIGIFEEQEPVSVPEAGSERERAMIEYAVELLRAIEEPVEIVGLGNEPIWETIDEDFQGAERRLIPFTYRVKDHLVEHYTVGDPRYLAGAFVRLYDESIRSDYGDVYGRLFDMARDDDDVDGIDLHVHYEHLEQAEEMLEIARKEVPDGTITATEFSPIWRYAHNVTEPIAGFEGGEEFAEEYGIDDGVTVTEYLEAAKSDQLSPDEMGAFMEAMPWYNVDFVEDMYGLLEEYDVELGTFGFLMDEGVHNVDWTDGWLPFPINCLFQPAVIEGETGAHPHYLDDFRERA